MMDDMREIYSRHHLVVERRLKEAMDKLATHHPQIAGRLRTIWRREDDAWARGEISLPTEVQDEWDEIHTSGQETVRSARYPVSSPESSVWARWCTYWRRW